AQSLALRDVDVDTDHASRNPSRVIRNKTARLDPAHLAVRAHDTILDVIFGSQLQKGAFARLLYAREIFRMRSGLPLAARGLYRSRRQTMHRRVTLGNLH